MHKNVILSTCTIVVMYLVLGIPLRERQKQGSIMFVGASEKTDIMDVLKPVVDDLRNCERYNYTPVFRRHFLERAQYPVLWYGDVRLSRSPSVRLTLGTSGSPSVCPFSALASYMH